MAYGYGPPRDPTQVLGRRFTAYLIDALITLIAFVAVLALESHQYFRDAPIDACAILRARVVAGGGSYNSFCVNVGSHALVWKQSAIFLADGLALLVGFLDLVVLQTVTGASVGKSVVGLRVVNEQGAPVGFGRMLARWLMLLIDGGIFLVGLITVLVTHPHRRVGDLAAGTFVVAAASAGAPIAVTRPSEVFAPPALAVPGYGGRPVPGWGPPTGAPGSSPIAAPDPAWGSPPPAAPVWTPPPPPAPPAPAAPAPAAPEPPPSAVPPWRAVPSTAPPPAPRWGDAAPPAPPPPPPAPAPPASPPAAPALPATSGPSTEPKPEPWWDRAIPAEPPDDAEPQP